VLTDFDLRTAHRWMVLSRMMEDRLRNLFTAGELRGRIVSGRGQEAVPAGSALTLRPDDAIAPIHRDLSAHLIRGTTPLEIFRQYLGRRTSLTAGRDGDVHMGDWSKGVFPMVSHLPDSFPVIGGIAFGFKLEESDRVAMAYCGDGSMSTGTWHESVNFAAVFDLPIVYILENNQYAYSTPLAKQSRVTHLADRGPAYGIPGVSVDGNDVAAVFDAASDAVARARAGEGPSFVECVTMRMDGHAIHDDASYVPRELLEHWRQRDPIVLAEAALREQGWTDDEGVALRAELAAEMKAAWNQAKSEPLPSPDELEQGVYAEPLAEAEQLHLRHQPVRRVA
jgi:TPP-dependent pyruvate/acetoin dehydrogenase alpha subunit